jgi:hypothetical protein
MSKDKSKKTDFKIEQKLTYGIMPEKKARMSEEKGRRKIRN